PATGAQGAVLVATEGSTSGQAPGIQAGQRPIEQCGVPGLRLDGGADIGVADGQDVEVDIAVVLFVIAQHHRVVAGLQIEVPSGNIPVLPSAGAGQLPGPHLFTVDVQRHALGSFERVGAIGVAKGHGIVARVIDSHVEGDVGAHIADGVDEARAGVPVVLGVDVRTAAQCRQLGFVVATVLRPDVSGQAVQGVPRLGTPQLLAVCRCEGLRLVRRTNVNHVPRLETVDAQRHFHLVLGHLSPGHRRYLFADLGPAVGGGGHVAPLRDRIGFGDVLHRLLRERLCVGDFEPVVGEPDLVHIEGVIADRHEFLQAVVQFSWFAPVARFTDAAGGDGSVRCHDGAVGTRVEAGAVAEDGALVLTFDLFDVDALQSAIGDIAEQYLAGEGPFVEQDRCTGRITDLVLRDPDGRRGHRLVLERAGRVGVVVEEAVLLDVHELGAGEPVALVVHHEDVLVRPPGDPVRGPQTAGDVADFTGVAVHLDRGAAVLGRLWVRGGTASVDGHGQAQVEVVLVVDEAEGELVEVAPERPLRDLFVLVVVAVAVRVGEFGQTVTFGDEGGVLDHCHAHRVVQAFGHLGGGDVLRPRGLLYALQQVHLAGVRVVGPATRADVAGGDDHEFALVGEVESRDPRFEALGTEVHQLVVRVDPGQWQAVTGTVDSPHAALHSRVGDPHDARLGGQHIPRDGLEAVLSKLFPFQDQPMVVRALQGFDPQPVWPFGSVD